MNFYTTAIAKLLKIDLETALRVQDEMSASGFDFSEATTRQFNAEARAAFATMEQTYRTEFPDYGLMDIEPPAGFADSSWHNDTCPSFAAAATTTGQLKLWIDYASPERREITEAARFTLCAISPDGDVFTILHTDDYPAILQAIETY